VINLRIWIIVSWIALPTVMFGGFSLLRLINRGNILSPFQVDCFRAGHAHRGVLLLMSLLYYNFLDQTTLSVSIKLLASALLFAHVSRAEKPPFCRNSLDDRGSWPVSVLRCRARIRPLTVTGKSSPTQTWNGESYGRSVCSTDLRESGCA